MRLQKKKKKVKKRETWNRTFLILQTGKSDLCFCSWKRYLRTTFLYMTYLPSGVRDGIHFTSCNRISSFILDQLQNVAKFNIFSIYNLNQVNLSFLSSPFLCSCFSLFLKLKVFVNIFFFFTKEWPFYKKKNSISFVVNIMLIH